MFKIGDTVRSLLDARILGDVVETDGNRVYIELSNGVEMDFDAQTLVLESEFQAQHDTSVNDDVASHANDDTYDAVIDGLYPAVLALGKLADLAATRVPGVTSSGWNAKSSLQKLNIISVITEVPVKDWVDAIEPGAKIALPALQMSVLAIFGKKAQSFREDG